MKKLLGNTVCLLILAGMVWGLAQLAVPAIDAELDAQSQRAQVVSCR